MQLSDARSHRSGFRFSFNYHQSHSQRERGRTVGDKDQKLQTEKRIIHNYRNNKKLGFLDLNFYDCCLCGMSPGHRPHTMQHAYTLSFIYSTHLYIWRICCKKALHNIISQHQISMKHFPCLCSYSKKKIKKFLELRFFRSQRCSPISLCNTLALLVCGCLLYWWSRVVVQRGAVCQEVYQQIKKISHLFLL